jgi:uncharacterized protein YjbJ (UPF0337 family)
MDWHRFSSHWPEAREKVQQRWTKLTEDDLVYISGDRDHFIERVQDRYDLKREEAELHLKNWLATEMA